VIPESIEQDVRNFAGPAPLARSQTAESRDYGKRYNEGDNNDELNER
jgi:hypothetical protein